MALQIRSTDTISGIPIKQVRRFFRHLVSWHRHSFELPHLQEHLALDKESELSLASELKSREYITPPENGLYTLTHKGEELVCASAAGKVSRETVNNSGTGIGQDRATLVGNPYSHGACVAANITTSRVDWLNPAAFQANPRGTFGNTGKGGFRLPRAYTWDMGVSKSFPLPSGGNSSSEPSSSMFSIVPILWTIACPSRTFRRLVQQTALAPSSKPPIRVSPTRAQAVLLVAHLARLHSR